MNHHFNLPTYMMQVLCQLVFFTYKEYSLNYFAKMIIFAILWIINANNIKGRLCLVMRIMSISYINRGNIRKYRSIFAYISKRNFSIPCFHFPAYNFITAASPSTTISSRWLNTCVFNLIILLSSLFSTTSTIALIVSPIFTGLINLKFCDK